MENSSKNGNGTTSTMDQVGTVPSTDTTLELSVTDSGLQASLSTKRSTQKHSNALKNSVQPSDGLAVAGLFFVVGLYVSFFPFDAHTPSIQEICQFLAYCCYAIGFLGAALN